jgi:hypothetical protein
MAMGNPRIHIICGICGNNKMFTYRVREDIDDDTEQPIQCVSLSCGNCHSLTDLDELMPEDKK